MFLLPWFFPLSYIYVTGYIFLLIGLDIKDQGPNCQQPTTPTTCPPPTPCVKTSYEPGFKSGHSFFVHSLQADDFSPKSVSVDVGRRTGNTVFDSTSNGHRRVTGMIASLERSSNSGDDNDDPHNEGGGKRLSSPNKNPRNSTSYSLTSDQRHSASYSHSPNKTQRTFMIYIAGNITWFILLLCSQPWCW